MLDHLGALHQQVVDRVVDPVEFGPQRGQTAGAPAIQRERFLLPRRWPGDRRRDRAGHHSRRQGEADLAEAHRSANPLHASRTHAVPPVASGARRSYASAAMDQPATRTDSARSYSHTHVTFDDGIALECGTTLRRHTVAYRTYGTLNADRTNAVLVCHALTGDQYVAEPHPITGKPGWWDAVVGPGRPVDTDRFFVICPNVLGGCMGSTGPLSNRELPDGTVPTSPGAPISRRSPSATWCARRSG